MKFPCRRGVGLLTALGIDEAAESVYRLMLTHQDWGVAEISEHLGLADSQVRATLDRLAELQLLRRSLRADGGLRPVSPAVGLRLILQEQESELLRRQQLLAQGQEAVLRLVDEYTGRRSTDEQHRMELLPEADDVQSRLEELADGCESEFLSFLPGGAHLTECLAATKPVDELLTARGVPVRALYQDSVRNDQETFKYAQHLNASGGEVRTVAALPLRVVLFDRRAALLPLDPDRTDKGLIQVTGPGIMLALITLFEQLWQSAVPFGGGRTAERDQSVLTGQEAELLRVLSRGGTDEIAARRLGIGLRTTRRMMADLMARLGAHSRFEAGVQAVRRGWIG